MLLRGTERVMNDKENFPEAYEAISGTVAI